VIILITSGEVYRLWSYSLHEFPQPLVNSCLLSPHILLSALLLDTRNLTFFPYGQLFLQRLRMEGRYTLISKNKKFYFRKKNVTTSVNFRVLNRMFLSIVPVAYIISVRTAVILMLLKLVIKVCRDVMFLCGT
jgi:hypothetical protein